MKRIIETSEQYHKKLTKEHIETPEECNKRLKEELIEQEDKDRINNTCPECGKINKNHGNISTHTEVKGIFYLKERTITTIRCIRCGCKFEYADKWKSFKEDI